MLNDEERIWLDINRIPLLDSKGKVVGILTTFDDITERTITEQKLKESEERFRSLVETTSDWIWEVDVNAIYKYVSPKVKDLLGYDPEEIIGKTPFDLMPHEEAMRVGEIFQSISQSRKSFANLENINICKNGEFIVLESSGVPIFNEYGHLMGYRGIDRNITERKQVEQKLKDSEEKYLHLFNSTPYAIWLVNLRGVIIDCNSTMNKFMSIFKKEDLIGKSFQDIIRLFLSKGDPRFENLEKVFRERFKLLIKQRYLDPIEFQISRGDGKPFWITLETSFVKLDNESLIQVFIKNITESKESEIKIKESEEKYRNLINNLSDVIVEIDLDSKFSYVSPQNFNIFGYKPDELIGLSVFKFIHNDDLTIVNKQIKEILKGNIVTIDYRILHKEGYYVPVSARGGVFESGGKRKATLIVRNVTERKKAEQKLKESEEKYRLLTVNINDIIWTMDLNLNTTFVSPSVTHVLGYTVEEDMAMPITKKFTPDSLKKIAKIVKKHINPKNINDKNYNPVFTMEFEQYHKNGSIIPTEITVNALRDENSVTIGLVGITRDITERKKAEQKVKESEEKFRLVVENANDMIAVLNRHIKYEYVNEQAFLRIMGRSKKDLIGKNPLKWSHPDDVEKAVEIFKKGFKGGKGKAELRFRNENGDYLWIEVRGRTFIDHNGEKKALIVSRDVTERRKAEHELKEINRMKSELMTRTSHELKTPLVSIKGYSDLLLDVYYNRLDNDTISIVENIKHGCERLENLIDDLL